MRLSAPPEIGAHWCSATRICDHRLGSSEAWPPSTRHRETEVYWPSTGQRRSAIWGLSGRQGDRWIDREAGAPVTGCSRRPGLRRSPSCIPAMTSAHLELLPDPLRDVLLMRFALHAAIGLVLILAHTSAAPAVTTVLDR